MQEPGRLGQRCCSTWPSDTGRSCRRAVFRSTGQMQRSRRPPRQRCCSSKALWRASRNRVSTVSRRPPTAPRVGMRPRWRRARKGDNAAVFGRSRTADDPDVAIGPRRSGTRVRVLHDQPPAVLAAACRARPLLDRGNDHQLGWAALTFGQTALAGVRTALARPSACDTRARSPHRPTSRTAADADPGCAQHTRSRSRFKPRATAHWRNTFIAVEISPRLAITPASRYGIRPWRHSSTRRGSSQPRPSSTSIAVTNLRSASAASAARTTRQSSLPPGPRGDPPRYTPGRSRLAPGAPCSSLEPTAVGDLRWRERSSRTSTRC